MSRRSLRSPERSRASTARPKRRALGPLFLLALLLLSGAVASAAAAHGRHGGPPKRAVTVMTLNLYLGTDLTRSITAASVPELLAANAQSFANVQQTDFPRRARVLAREIDQADPGLLGLQEVERWYSGPLGDPAPAQDLEYDFLRSLRRALARRGTPYDVVSIRTQAEFEAPAGAPYNKDFRLVDQDAILVRRDLRHKITLSDARPAAFANNLTVTTGTGMQLTITRGWVSVEAAVRGWRFRLVNTHLESFHPGVRLQQAQELVAAGGPVGSAPGDVVLAGDINSGPEQSIPDSLAFNALTGTGLIDTWMQLHPGDPGLTCCFSELLDDPSPEGVFSSRIDHVLVSPGVTPLASRIHGTAQADRTRTGLWPSDHAGVAATLAGRPGPR